MVDDSAMTESNRIQPRILIAGIGNIFMGDDAFGVEVAHRLAQRPLADGVRVVDFGIRGLDLAWLFAGVLALGFCAYAAWHFGPDLVRYIKIERM